MAGITGPAIGNISISGADGAIQDGANSAIEATVLDYTNSNPLAVRLTDTAGDYVSAIAVTNAGTFAVQTTSSITGIGHGVTTVTTAGTDVVLAASTACKKVIIQSQTDNTTGIAVGGSGVDATIATGTGVFLYPGDIVELEIDNLNDVYIDSLTSGEGVRYTWFS